MKKGTGRMSSEPAATSRGWFIAFLFIFVALAFLSYLVSAPLVKPLSWAMLLSFMVYPVFRRLRDRYFPRSASGNWAATLATGVVVLLLVVPTLFAGFVAAREGVRFYETVADVVAEMGTSGEGALSALLPERTVEKIQVWTERYPILRTGLRQAAEFAAATAVAASKEVLGSTLTFLYYLAMIIVFSFFLIRDGHLIIEYLKDIMPLPQRESEAFFRRAQQVLQAVVYGVIVTALSQGVVGAVGWLIVGLPSPVFFGALMALFAMIPLLGTALVWVPGAIYLFYTSSTMSAVILLAWGVLVVSMVDTLMRPMFISEGAQVHLLIVFVGVIGGVASWGILGLFMGPLVVTLFVFLLDYYRTSWRTMFLP